MNESINHQLQLTMFRSLGSVFGTWLTSLYVDQLGNVEWVVIVQLLYLVCIAWYLIWIPLIPPKLLEHQRIEFRAQLEAKESNEQCWLVRSEILFTRKYG